MGGTGIMNPLQGEGQSMQVTAYWGHRVLLIVQDRRIREHDEIGAAPLVGWVSLGELDRRVAPKDLLSRNFSPNNSV
jgi:hypothetical protein